MSNFNRMYVSPFDSIFRDTGFPFGLPNELFEQEGSLFRLPHPFGVFAQPIQSNQSNLMAKYDELSDRHNNYVKVSKLLEEKQKKVISLQDKLIKKTQSESMEELDLYQQTCSKLNKENMDLKEKVRTLSLDLEHLKRDIDDIDAQAEWDRSMIPTLHDKIKELEDQNKVLMHNREQTLIVVRKLETQVQTASAEIEKRWSTIHNSLIDTHNADMLDCNSQIDQLQNENIKAVYKIQSLKSDLNEALDKQFQLQLKIELEENDNMILTNANNLLSKTATEQANRITELELELNSTDADNDDLNNIVDELQMNLDMVNLENDHLRDVIKKSADDFDKMRLDYADIADKYLALTESNKFLTERVDELADRAHESELAEKKRIEQESLLSTSKLSDVQRDLKEREERIDKLMSQLKIKDFELGRMEEKMDELTSQLKSKNTELARFEEKMEEMLAQHTCLQRMYDDMVQSVETDKSTPIHYTGSRQMYDDMVQSVETNKSTPIHSEGRPLLFTIPSRWDESD